MSNELAATNNAVALSKEDQEIMDFLKSQSGENENQKYVNIPYLTIDNSMVDLEVDNGQGGKRTVKARCEGRFLVNCKEGDEYKKEVFVDKFNAIVLAYRHRVQRKYLQDQSGNCINTIPYFRSLEFKSFRDSIYLRMENDFSNPMTYQEVKTFAKDTESELWGVIYVLIEGEDIVRKLEVKGASRSAFFDFLTAKRDDSISSFYTEFSVDTLNDAPNPYNKLVVKKADLPRPELKMVAEKVMGLLKLLGDGKPSQSAIEPILVDNSKVSNDDILEEVNSKNVDELFEA